MSNTTAVNKSRNEEKKAYLKSYLPKVAAAKRIEEEIEELRMSKMFPSMEYDDMPHAHNKTDLSGYMARVDELEKKLIQARYEKINLYTKIFNDVERMENENEKAVITYRYLRGYSWEKIALKMEYSWRQIHNIHGKALQNFEVYVE